MEQISVTSNELGLVVNNIIKKKFQEATELGFIEKNKLNELFTKLCIIKNNQSKEKFNLEKCEKNTNIINEKNFFKINKYNKHPKTFGKFTIL